MQVRSAVRWLWLFVVGGLGLPGCGSGDQAPKAPERPFQGQTVVVAAVGDPALLESVMAQRGEWQETSGATIRVVEAPVEPGAIGEADVLLVPGDRLGALVDASDLAVLPESVVRPPARQESATEDGTPAEPPAHPLDFDDVVPAQRDRVSKYGNDRLGLPYGGTALVLAYRREALEDEALTRAAREAGLSLDPPRTWEELDALARFLHGRDWDGDGQPEAGIAIALGADPEGLADATYLARAAALGQHRDQYSFLFDSDSMEPRIASPPFVEALAGLVALKEFAPPGAAGFDAEAARKAFRSGEAALLIDRAERASTWTDHEHPGRVGVAALPGSARVFDPLRGAWETSEPINRPTYLPRGGGWLVGLSARTQGPKREAALDLARYLASPDVGRRIWSDRAFPMLPIRSSALLQGPPDPRSAPGVDPRLWTGAVEPTLSEPRAVVGLRIPGADAYLADLGRARVAAVEGEPAEASLRACAEAWAARNRELGPEHQLWHYRRSLNRLATAPKPPPRGR